MMAAIASLISTEPITIEDPACIDISYPNFFEDLETSLVNSTKIMSIISQWITDTMYTL